MIQLYGIPNCDQIRKTKKFLNGLAFDFEFVNIRTTPLTVVQLKQIVGQLGMDRTINSRGTTYRRLNIKDRALNDDQLFDAVLNEQTLIKRPLLENNDRYFIGYDEEGIKQFLSFGPGKTSKRPKW